MGNKKHKRLENTGERSVVRALISWEVTQKASLRNTVFTAYDETAQIIQN